MLRIITRILKSGRWRKKRSEWYLSEKELDLPWLTLNIEKGDYEPKNMDSRYKLETHGNRFFLQPQFISFLLVSVTDWHKISGLKQHIFIILWLWESELQNQFHWIKVKVSAGPLSPRSSKEKSIACLFIASRAAFLASLGSWLPLLSSKIAAQLGGPVAKLYVPSGGSLGLILGQGTKIPQAVGCRQIRKKKKKEKKVKITWNKSDY